MLPWIATVPAARITARPTNKNTKIKNRASTGILRKGEWSFCLHHYLPPARLQSFCPSLLVPTLRVGTAFRPLCGLGRGPAPRSPAAKRRGGRSHAERGNEGDCPDHPKRGTRRPARNLACLPGAA